MIEMIVGSVLITTVLVAMLGMLGHQHRLSRLDREIDQALTACRNSLEEMRDFPFDRLATLDGKGFDVLGPNGQPRGLTAIPGDVDGLPGRISVALDRSSGGEKIYLVVLTVDWKGVSGEQHFEFTGLIAERKGG